MILFFLKRKIKPTGVLGRYPAVTLTLVPSSKPKKHFTPLKKKVVFTNPTICRFPLAGRPNSNRGKKRKKALQQVMSTDEWREKDGWMRFRCKSLMWILLLT